MKHGKKPTVVQKMFIHERGLEWREWLVVKDMPDMLEVVHRETGKLEKYYK